MTHLLPNTKSRRPSACTITAYGLLFALQEGNVLYPLSPFPTLLVTPEAASVDGTHGLLYPLDSDGFGQMRCQTELEGRKSVQLASPCGVAEG